MNKSRKRTYWPAPQRRSLASSSDLRLFFEAMVLIKKFGLVSKKQLKNELSSRVKGLKLIKHLSETGTENLIKELKLFGWIRPDRKGIFERSELGVYMLTNEGLLALRKYKRNRHEFLSLLIMKMHKEYVIPGWFIDRLWKLNPKGQGQVIIPTPLKRWNPKSKEWDDCQWNQELNQQVIDSYNVIKRMASNSFMIPLGIWLNAVETAWNRLSSLKKRTDIEGQKFAPRNRLTLAMKEAAIGLMFNNNLPESEKNDFGTNKTPLAPRTYMAWCPRLEELELIFYTDYHNSVPGRIIVPVSVFRENSGASGYEFIDIGNLDGENLALHRPKWEEFRKNFMVTLYRVYQESYLKKKSLYVSVQNVRDEVCRQLRLSSACFDDFLSKLITESINGVVSLTISTETDVREDQRQAHQLERRPVNINGKFCSLIAITKHKMK